MNLWEIDHPYYCNQANYYAHGGDQPMESYKSWSEFIGAEGDADLDMNLVFRWDWRHGEDYELPPYRGDDNYRDGKMLIFFMGQRKGLYRSAEVEVCRNDEAAVLEYLKPRWQHLVDLWAPVANNTGELK